MDKRAYVLETGSCSDMDHEIIEVFLGTEAEADARAIDVARERGWPDYNVINTAVPLTRAEDALQDPS